MTKRIHITQAMQDLRKGLPCEIKVWKATTGEVIEYRNAVYKGHDKRHGTFRIYLQTSHQTREFREVCVFEYNGMEVHL